MDLTKYERETVINYNQEEKIASCYTHDRALIRKLDSFCEKSSDIIVTRNDDGCKEYTFPKKWIRIVIPRQLSDEKRAELKLRAMNNFHNQQKFDGKDEMTIEE